MANQAFEINIRDPGGRAQLVTVDPNWSVGHVKEEFSRQTGIPVGQFKLVFAGQALNEGVRLQDFGLQSYSTLHCIRGRSTVLTAQVPPSRGGATPSTPSVREVERKLAQVNVEDGDHDENCRFFVYCKKCKGMTKGKLRVRCVECRDPAFVLSTEPQGWEDVLAPQRLQGHCNSPHCNRRRYAEFYFKCAEHDQRGEGDAEECCVALHMVRVNTVQAPCAACYDTEDVVIVFDCQEQHVMCKECFIEYCKNALASRSFKEHRNYGYTLQCPGHCDDSYISEIHHFRLMTTDEYDRYQRFGTEECLLAMGGVLCPRPNCGMGILPEGNYGNRIQCPECQFVFCKECKSEYHRGPCEPGGGAQLPGNTQAQGGGTGQQFDPQRLEQARWNDASRRFIAQNQDIKRCPQCRVEIEKSGGCMHMTCGRCHYDFCWICLIAWNTNCQTRHWFGER